MGSLFSPEVTKWVTLAIFTLTFALILYRKIPIQYLSPGAAALLLIFGIIHPKTAFLDSDNEVS